MRRGGSDQKCRFDTATSEILVPAESTHHNSRGLLRAPAVSYRIPPMIRWGNLGSAGPLDGCDGQSCPLPLTDPSLMIGCGVAMERTAPLWHDIISLIVSYGITRALQLCPYSGVSVHHELF